MFQLPIDKLQALFAAVAAKETLYIPADDAAGQPRYQRWQEGLEMTKALNTVRSAKDFFFPQTEDLVDFKVKGKEIEIIDPRTELHHSGQGVSRAAGGQLLQVPQGARHRCDHGLHASRGDLLLLRFRH